jgi:PAS domain S-box-containing protein
LHEDHFYSIQYLNSKDMNTPLSPTLLQAVQHAFEQLKNLPFPVHVSDASGRFLFANAAAAKLFKLSDDLQTYPSSIISYFEDPAERTHLLRLVKKTPFGQWREDLTARLNIDGEHYKIRFASTPYYEDGQLAVLLNIANSMSIIEWFKEFEDELVLGLFEIDKEFRIVDSNAALVQMMGYSSLSEIKNKPVADFFWNRNDAGELFDELRKTQLLKHKQAKLRRKDDAMVIVEMSCSTISWEEGQIARVKGILRDITFDVIQEVNPLGLFLISSKTNGEDIFSRVNGTFAHIHGFESPDEILGLPANTFQPTSNDDYIEALNKAAGEGNFLLDHFMDVVDKNGVKHNVVVNARYVYGEAEKIRVGAVYDLTNHVGRHKRTLETNFSAVLHTYIATIDGLRSMLGMLLKAHGQDLLKGEAQLDRQKVAQEIERHKSRLGNTLQQLIEVARERGTDESKFALVQKHWRNLAINHETEMSNASWLRLNLIEIRKHLEALKNLNLPREQIRGLRSEVEDILRLSSMVSISISLNELNDRIHDFYYFRDYLRRGDIEKPDLKPFNLISILNKSIHFLEEFASLNGVTVKQLFNSRDIITVACNDAVLNRALHSLIHNAIKYSWSKGQERRPWVEIKVEKKQDTVELTIENWGVPIRKEELENDFIFQFGKRGKESDDRGRAGTGIGLFDAREIILRHGGTLALSSEPTAFNLPDVYTNPFITRAHIVLPLYK